MSKKVSIIEGQTSKHFGKTSKLQTKLKSEGYCFWVPKDESKLVTKRITKNGTYYARNEKDTNKVPYYGFSRITVAVSNKIHGKKKENPPPPPAHNGDWTYPQNGDGNDYGYSSDDNDNIIEQALPSSIKIDTLPNKTVYNKGETIDITGIAVNGYNADGTLWGQIPFNELTFEPKNAIGGSSGGGYISDDITLKIPMPIPASKTVPKYTYKDRYGGWEEGSEIVKSVRYPAFVVLYKNQNTEVVRDYSAVGVVVNFNDNVIEAVAEGPFGPIYSANTYTHEGKTVYYANIGSNISLYTGATEFLSESSNLVVLQDAHDIGYIDAAEKGKIAWVIRYGKQQGAGGTVAVNWKRPVDSLLLTDTFNISVS